VKIVHGIDAPLQLPELVLGIGIFDGVHRGHQALLGRVVQRARQRGGTPGALTFHPHPLAVLDPLRAPCLLVSLDHRLALLRRLSLEVVVVASFTPQLASMEPEVFVEEVLIRRLGAAALVTGESFRFGYCGRGDTELLCRLAKRLGVEAEVVSPVYDHQLISSTAIRVAIERGDLQEASRLLGRPVSLMGRVVSGSGRGRALGFPTANVLVDEEVAPPRGVYVVTALVDGVGYPGVANVGVRPTFGEHSSNLVVEAHIFDFSSTLYDRELEVQFLRKLRDEVAFPTVAALIAQIVRDVEQARAVHALARSTAL